MTGFNEHLQVDLLGMEGNQFLIGLDIQPHHLHEKGLLHGGVILSLLDIAMSRAIRDNIKHMQYSPTIELSCSFIRPAKEGRILTQAKVIYRSRTLCRADGKVLDKEGRIIAAGRGTMMLISE